ncbi:MAG: zf-TFIIB domain-containing protein [Planctomycetota bacterium]
MATSDPRPSGDRSETTRSCPVCGEAMIKERERGVTIDVCDEHGIWLDKGELEAIRRSVASRQRIRHRRAVREARRRGKMSGAFWGWMALLWDG